MGSNVCWGVLCALALVIPCLSQGDDMFSVVVDVKGDSISVQMEGELDICKTFVCPQGTKCEVQMAPALLKIPMPRCVPDKTAKPIVDGCKEISVATNILQCRSRDEWTQVGRTQCQLNTLQEQPLRLVNSKAWHVCPPLSFPPMIRYLSASFNCCMEEIVAETTSQPEMPTPSKMTESAEVRVAAVRTDAPPAEQLKEEEEEEAVATTEKSTGLQYVKDKLNDLGQEAIKLTGMDSTEATEQSSNLFYLLLIILGLSFLLSFLLISLLVSLRLKHRRRQRQQQRKSVVTSVINPGAADSELEHVVHFSNDKASLVDNMQITH